MTIKRFPSQDALSAYLKSHPSERAVAGLKLQKRFAGEVIVLVQSYPDAQTARQAQLEADAFELESHRLYLKSTNEAARKRRELEAASVV